MKSWLKQNWKNIAIGLFLILVFLYLLNRFVLSEFDISISPVPKDSVFLVDDYPIQVISWDFGTRDRDLNDDAISDKVFKSRLGIDGSYYAKYDFYIAGKDNTWTSVNLDRGSERNEFYGNSLIVSLDNCAAKDIRLVDTRDLGVLLVIARKEPSSELNDVASVFFDFYKLREYSDDGLEAYIYDYDDTVASEHTYCNVNDALNRETPVMFQKYRNRTI